jgi:ferredoxin
LAGVLATVRDLGAGPGSTGTALVLLTDERRLPVGYTSVPEREEYEPLADLLTGSPSEVVVADNGLGGAPTVSRPGSEYPDHAKRRTKTIMITIRLLRDDLAKQPIVTTPSGPQPRSVSISIDEAHCAASALCAWIAPDLFALEEHASSASVRKPSLTETAEIALAEEAERSCPTLAISLKQTTEALP